MIERKRYILLVGDVYYPAGWSDFQGSYHYLETAKAAGEHLASKEYTWFQVVDLVTDQVVAGDFD